MVKKSLLSRLFGWKTEEEPAPGRVSSSDRTANGNRHGSGQSAEIETPRPAEGLPVQASTMPREQEMGLRLQEGIQGITSVLSGIDRKLDDQERSSRELTVSVQKIPEMMKDVPENSRAGLELLNTLSSILEKQSATTRDVAQSVTALENKVDETATNYSRKQESLVAELRRQQTEHSTQVDQLMKKSSNAQKLFIFLIVVLIGVLLLVVHQLSAS